MAKKNIRASNVYFYEGEEDQLRMIDVACGLDGKDGKRTAFRNFIKQAGFEKARAIVRKFLKEKNNA